MAKNTRAIKISDGKTAVTLLVNPESIKTSEPMITKKKELLSGGYLYVGKPGLRARTIDTFLPSTGSGFGDGGSQLRQLEDWRKAGTALLVSITGLDTITCKITDMATTVKEGDPDAWISVTLTEYRALRKKRKAAASGGTAASTGTKAKAKAKKKTQYYTVKKGDCLYRIAKKYYGKGSEWPTIYKANKKVIGNNPNLIYPGQKLVIPQ